MIVQIFGLLDILSAVSFVLLKFNILTYFGLVFGIYLIIKSLIFIRSVISIIDLICGVILIISYFGFFSILSWMAAVWLIQKAIFSLIKF